MNITSVSYVKLFPLGMYINEKIGVEVSLEAGEDAMLALDTARNLVHEYHEKNNPTPYSGISVVADNVPVPEVQINEPPAVKQTKEERQKADIASSPDVKTLESYRLIVKKYPYLQEVYDETMKKLTKTA